jgi:hypothetical protein
MQLHLYLYLLIKLSNMDSQLIEEYNFEKSGGKQSHYRKSGGEESFHDDFLHGLFFDFEDAGDMFLRNIC